MRVHDLFRKLGEQSKLSHAYLLSGNDIIQKKELIALTTEAANIHTADQMVVDSTGNEITIAEVRSWTSFFSMSPWASLMKSGVIHDAHLMNKEAQSAFLKLLEEPKGNAVFFLTTQYPDLLLDTIRSRTQEFKFYISQKKDIEETVKGDFEKLQKSNLYSRFEYAKKLGEIPEEIPVLLEQWLKIAREAMHAALRQNQAQVQPLARTLKNIQEILLLLRTTNVNPRLALEHSMLDLTD
jgi:DNA polymerase III delta prime subunit